MKYFLTFILFFDPSFLGLHAEEWKTEITTEEESFTFGGPLLEEEKNLVGKWKGINEHGDIWEIFRRPNHLFSIQVSWLKKEKRDLFRTWSVGSSGWQFSLRRYFRYRFENRRGLAC